MVTDVLEAGDSRQSSREESIDTQFICARFWVYAKPSVLCLDQRTRKIRVNEADGFQVARDTARALVL